MRNQLFFPPSLVSLGSLTWGKVLPSMKSREKEKNKKRKNSCLAKSWSPPLKINHPSSLSAVKIS